MTITIATPVRADIHPALLARWRAIPVAVAVDLAPEIQISPVIRPLRPAGQQPRLCARAITALCQPPDFGAVLGALDLVRPGQVLVIDAQGHAGNAMIGDILGGHLNRRGVAGVVCDGAVRDVATLAGMPDFAVYCRSINPRGPTGGTKGAINVPVTIGGRAVAPGDLILGDDDGLAALTPAHLPRLIDAAEAKLRLEENWTRRLTAGDPVRSIFGLG